MEKSLLSVEDKLTERTREIYDILSTSEKSSRVYSSGYLGAAGFQYTRDKDMATCRDCGLGISNWTQNMNPFQIHAAQKPDCSFVQSITKNSLSFVPKSASATTTALRNTTSSNEQENPSKRIKIESMDFEYSPNTLLEVDFLIQVRRRGFSHWPHRTIPSSAQMIEAGWFYCNVGDRVMCLYCNLICQQWTPHTDDPCEVHKTLSPNCIYVRAKLIRPAASSILIVNENSTTVISNGQSTNAANLEPLRSHEIVFTAACNPAYAELPKRHASFATWPHENLPPVDDLVRAGFFYTGTKTIVTCFYCNGSLQNWGAGDNPMIEHARWFPHCTYVKLSCGDEIYRKIQESKRAQQERAQANEARIGSGTTTNSHQLCIPDENTLAKLVAARLDFPMSRQPLENKRFELSIIKRCWEDQLRLKKADFASAYDLHIACLIFQEQIERIDGKKENIVVPSIKIRQIRDEEQKLIEKTRNWKEDRSKTNEREKSLLRWPREGPSPLKMLKGGWSGDRTKGEDHTFCKHCLVEHNNWKSTDDPFTIHRQLSPSCPFVLAREPIHRSSVPIKSLEDVFTQEEIRKEAVKSDSKLILTSYSEYALPQKRQQSFLRFCPALPVTIMKALILSGFYCAGASTLLRCYDCGLTVNNFHECPIAEINKRHSESSPNCHYARLMTELDTPHPTNDNTRCRWCFDNPNELTVSPCMEHAICRSCAEITSVCRACSQPAEAFCRLFT